MSVIPSSAFTVKTPDANLTVLGTIFSVNAKQSGYTQLDVYEGAVALERLSDEKKVKVEANLSVSTSYEKLETVSLESLSQNKTEVISIRPIDDVYSEGNKMVNSNQLRVRKGERVIYLKFEVLDIGQVKKAVLQMKQEIDPGSGTLSFYLGDHNDWNENDIKHKNAPKPVTLIAKRTGAVTLGKTISVDLSKGIKGDGVYTVIITLNKGDAHDIWFSSKEGKHPPTLKLSR